MLLAEQDAIQPHIARTPAWDLVELCKVPPDIALVILQELENETDFERGPAGMVLLMVRQEAQAAVPRPNSDNRELSGLFWGTGCLMKIALKSKLSRKCYL